MGNALDLDAYFNRVNWRGPTACDYATLAGLLSAHKGPYRLRISMFCSGGRCGSTWRGCSPNWSSARRGGYCFEHATLLAAALERLGFAPVRHAARVIVFLPPSESPRTHMFLTVDVDGARYVLDPGFGPFGSRLPVPLDGAGVPADRPTHRMVRDGELWVMHTTRDGAQMPGWVSTLEVEHPVDFEMANHFTATHPSSLFVRPDLGERRYAGRSGQYDEPRRHGLSRGESGDLGLP